MLSTIDPKHRGDGLKVIQHLSHNIGMVNMSDVVPPVPFRGNKDGVLEGRWASSFPGGVPPGMYISII